MSVDFEDSGKAVSLRHCAEIERTQSSRVTRRTSKVQAKGRFDAKLGFRYRASILMSARRSSDHQDLYSGLIRLHILHHACEEEFFGLAMIEELRRHGYRLSAGTLYPLLHGMERKGLLRSRADRHGRTVRRFYAATSAGRRALRVAKARVRELFGEMFEHD
jgi:PadR family transcriptional regulator, regulatory protein PadR